MAEVTIYTTNLCGYCRMAKSLLTRKGAVFTEVDVSHDLAARRLMEQRANGHRTVPQIFVGRTHVGGCEDLQALDAAGRLDLLLAAS
jgi:glutaredoxin 3